MCSSFYNGPGQVPVGEDEEEERHQGDLADMIRSSNINPRRCHVGDLYSQVIHDQISLTSAAAADDSFSQQQQEEESCVDHRISRGSEYCLLDVDPFSSISTSTTDPDLLYYHRNTNYTSATHDLLLPTRSSSSSSMMQMIIKSKAAAAGDGLHLDRGSSSYLYSSSGTTATPGASTFTAPPPAAAISMTQLNEDHASASCCFHNHVSSPSRNPAIKRSRKSLAKKVVCIPAPAPANSRPSGEVVPSDLWAWRKYGQKPIKGSPYPRGYYRCSSSKGCSARKQVERSRTDPNMLVITYTSEHNHPWPTQRNALAGSTRSHPSKNTTITSPWTGAVVVDDQMKWRISGDHELKPEPEMIIKQHKVDDHIVASSVLLGDQYYSINQHDYKCSRDYQEDEQHYNWRCSTYNKTYRPDLAEYNNEPSKDDDFFAELGEIAGKDHNAFTSFLMEDWPPSERVQDHGKPVI